ncbi:MAG: ABC transporter ATP-binding protein [Anaerolineae bacterium]|nr:ABC transporter ATP-binding protein [Anaerolineae bacterium]
MLPKIDVQGLSVQFMAPQQGEPITALADLNLQVGAGEFVAVVGPSGGGKTTLLRVIAGLERAGQGAAQVHRADPKRPATAMVFQDAGLFPWMSVLENIAYGMRMQGIRGKQRYELALFWLGRMGLTRFADAFPHQLSGGMRQRVGLARAFAHNPEVLLMDEPFAALDAQTRLELHAALLELWDGADMTVLFVTHSIEEALTLADRAVVLSARPGRVIAEFRVAFPRPRDPVALRTDYTFGQQYAAIWDVLRGEVQPASEGALST